MEICTVLGSHVEQSHLQPLHVVRTSESEIRKHWPTHAARAILNILVSILPNLAQKAQPLRIHPNAQSVLVFARLRSFQSQRVRPFECCFAKSSNLRVAPVLQASFCLCRRAKRTDKPFAVAPSAQAQLCVYVASLM